MKNCFQCQVAVAVAAVVVVAVAAAVVTVVTVDGAVVNVIKLFSQSLMTIPNKLERLYQASLSRLVKYCQVRLEPSRIEHLSCAPF